MGRRPSAGGPLDSLPESQRVEFQQRNPKKRGSTSNQRYEGYKKARTVGEALRAGAAPGDLKFDLSKGYMRILPAAEAAATQGEMGLGARCFQESTTLPEVEDCDPVPCTGQFTGGFKLPEVGKATLLERLAARRSAAGMPSAAWAVSGSARAPLVSRAVAPSLLVHGAPSPASSSNCRSAPKGSGAGAQVLWANLLAPIDLCEELSDDEISSSPPRGCGGQARECPPSPELVGSGCQVPMMVGARVFEGGGQDLAAQLQTLSSAEVPANGREQSPTRSVTSQASADRDMGATTLAAASHETSGVAQVAMKDEPEEEEERLDPTQADSDIADDADAADAADIADHASLDLDAGEDASLKITLHCRLGVCLVKEEVSEEAADASAAPGEAQPVTSDLRQLLMRQGDSEQAAGGQQQAAEQFEAAQLESYELNANERRERAARGRAAVEQGDTGPLEELDSQLMASFYDTEGMFCWLESAENRLLLFRYLELKSKAVRWYRELAETYFQSKQEALAALLEQKESASLVTPFLLQEKLRLEAAIFEMPEKGRYVPELFAPSACLASCGRDCLDLE